MEGQVVKGGGDQLRGTKLDVMDGKASLGFGTIQVEDQTALITSTEQQQSFPGQTCQNYFQTGASSWKQPGAGSAGVAPRAHTPHPALCPLSSECALQEQLPKMPWGPEQRHGWQQGRGRRHGKGCWMDWSSGFRVAQPHWNSRIVTEGPKL